MDMCVVIEGVDALSQGKSPAKSMSRIQSQRLSLRHNVATR